MDKSRIIQDVCLNISKSDKDECLRIISNHYPFNIVNYEARTFSDFQATKVFIRDGFIDRYSGKRLVFPAVLKIISNEFPIEFPYQKNWKMSECHIAYWELVPTLDHIVPIARGGANDESNWVCTSMLRNSAKSNFTLEELGWSLLPSGDFSQWDGMIRWFMRHVEKNMQLLKDNYIHRWYKAAGKCLNE